MPFRQPGFIETCFGVCALIVIGLLGRNVYHAAAQGPRWWRRIIGAGLSLFISFGLLSPASGQGTDQISPAPSLEESAVAPSLENIPSGKHLLEIWTLAEEIGSGKRGDYPFNSEEKGKVLAGLDMAKTSVDDLVKQGVYAAPEGDLLKLDLDQLKHQVQSKRTKEMMDATCYKPMMFRPAEESLGRIQQRLPLLEKLAAGKVRGDVLEKSLKRIEADAKVLKEALPQADQSLTAQHPEKVLARIDEILKSLRGQTSPATPPATSEGWLTLARLFEVGRQLVPASTGQQRDDFDLQLQACLETLKDDENADLVAFMRLEAGFLTALIRENPPSDVQVDCYSREFIAPAKASLERLEKRLPYLQQFSTQGKLAAATRDKILASLENDYRTLLNPEELQQLSPKEQAKAEKVAARVRAKLIECGVTLP